MSDQPDAISVTYTTLLEHLATLPSIDAVRRTQQLAAKLAHHADMHVRLARREGATWQELADALGVTRSAVHQRFSWVDAPEHLQPKKR